MTVFQTPQANALLTELRRVRDPKLQAEGMALLTRVAWIEGQEHSPKPA